jgi:hypothetical protein
MMPVMSVSAPSMRPSSPCNGFASTLASSVPRSAIAWSTVPLKGHPRPARQSAM